MVLERQYCVYIMTNKKNTVLYTGVTNDLRKRVYEHKEKLAKGFTKRYNVNKVIYYEVFQDSENAILREKQIKHDDISPTQSVIPGLTRNPVFFWIPAFAGMTPFVAINVAVHKGGSRAKKIALVNSMNPEWKDLYDEL
jgi:putative endonuclease